MGIFTQKRLGPQNHSRRAKAALKPAIRDERFLQRVKLPILRQTFDGQNRPSPDFESERRARAHRPPVDEQGASATDLNVARKLDAGQTEPIADHIEQELVRLHLQLLEPPVESKRKRYRLSVRPSSHRFGHESSQTPPDLQHWLSAL